MLSVYYLLIILFDTEMSAANVKKVAIIGSGNWGSAIARIIGENVKKFNTMFQESVAMWVFEEVSKTVEKLVNING